MALWRRTGHHHGFVCTKMFEQPSGIYSRFLNLFIFTIKSFCTISGKAVIHIAVVMTSVPILAPNAKAPAPALNTTPSLVFVFLQHQLTTLTTPIMSDRAKEALRAESTHLRATAQDVLLSGAYLYPFKARPPQTQPFHPTLTKRSTTSN